MKGSTKNSRIVEATATERVYPNLDASVLFVVTGNDEALRPFEHYRKLVFSLYDKGTSSKKKGVYMFLRRCGHFCPVHVSTDR